MILDLAIPSDEIQVIVSSVASEVEGMLEGPVEVHVHVVRPRLQAHFGSGASEGLLRESAPVFPIGRNAMERGAQVVAGCEGVVWVPGALSAVFITCEYGEVGTRVRIRKPLAASIGDMIRAGLFETPLVHPF